MEQVQLDVDVAVIFFAGGTGVDEMPRGCRSHYSLSGLPRIPEEVLLGLRVWDPEGSTAISVQHTKRRIFKILNIQIHRIHVFAILYFVYFTNII